MAITKAQIVNFKIFVYLLMVTTLIFYVLGLVGCISNSPGIPNLNIIAIESLNSTSSDALCSVKVGYFGVCLRHPALADGTECLSTSGQDAPRIAAYFAERTSPSTNGSSPDFNLAETELALDVALRVQRSFFCYFLTIPAVAFFSATISLTLLLHSIKAGNSASRAQRLLKLATLFLLGISVAGSAVAALVATQIAASLHLASEVSSDARLGFVAGVTSIAIHWVIVGMSCVATVSLAAMLRRVGTGENPKTLAMPPYPVA